MPKFKNIFIISVLIFFFVLLSINSYVDAITNDLASSVLRLHVIANSDSAEDQALKFKVRDGLLEYMNYLSVNVNSKDDSVFLVQDHLSDFKNIAKEIIIKSGYDYDVTVELGKFGFPSKSYGDISLPAGVYDALEVKIGNSLGHNWWCVMFPPLCFVDITSGEVPEDSKESLKDTITDEEYSIISKSDNTSEFKFKIIELFNNFKLANKSK